MEELEAKDIQEFKSFQCSDAVLSNDKKDDSEAFTLGDDKSLVECQDKSFKKKTVSKKVNL